MPVILITALCLNLAPAAFCRTWHVALDGSGDTSSIQQALAASVSGDTILVHPGRYIENIDFLGKGVLLKSTTGPDATTIDGSGTASSTVVFQSNEPPEAVLEGFTVTGGRGTHLGSALTAPGTFDQEPGTLAPEGTYGGGILCTQGSPTIRGNYIRGNRAQMGGGVHVGRLSADTQSSGAPLISGNVISDNLALGNGGGVRLTSSATRLENNIFENNHAMYDGGGADIRLDAGSVAVERNMFRNNLAGDHGGGLQVSTDWWGWPGPRVTISQCLFHHNVANGSDTGETGAGGGIHAIDLIGSIVSNTIVDNQASGEVSCSGGGISFFGIVDEVMSTVRLNIIAFNTGCGISCRSSVSGPFGPNILWSNDGGDIGESPESCPAAWTGTTVFADPQFCNRVVGDYTVSTTSPAITGDVKFGVFTDPTCPGVPVVPTTWGAVKALYR